MIEQIFWYFIACMAFAFSFISSPYIFFIGAIFLIIGVRGGIGLDHENVKKKDVDI